MDDFFFEEADGPGRYEMRLALDYLAREALKLDMPLVANLIGAASEAISLYEPGSDLRSEMNLKEDGEAEEDGEKKPHPAFDPDCPPAWKRH